MPPLFRRVGRYSHPSRPTGRAVGEAAENAEIIQVNASSLACSKAASSAVRSE